jgi:hypothetical protein
MADVLMRDADPLPIRAAAAEPRANLAERAESPAAGGED